MPDLLYCSARGWVAVLGIGGLTSHSSRCRFAARLNSGVRGHTLTRTNWMFAIAVAAWLPGTASAGSVALVTDRELCNRAPPLEQAANLKASRNGDIVTLSVTAHLNCAYRPGEPELRVHRNAATVALPTHSPSGMATACNCAHQMTFEISDLYEGARTIYYVQDGSALGHVDAP